MKNKFYLLFYPKENFSSFLFIFSNLLYFIVLILIFSGAIGNFIDRLKNKYVIDFIYFKPIDFPVFNCADIYITIACFLMIIYLIFENKNEKGLIKG